MEYQSIKAVVYPYTTGAVIVFTLDWNASNNTEYRSESASLQESIEKTALFTDAESASRLVTPKIIMGRNFIVMVKGDDRQTWNEGAAKDDVKGIIEKILKQ